MVVELGFTVSFDVCGRRSIADLLPKSRDRCGIYLLEFADGLFYIGQALDVVRRFSQHSKRHGNIVRWSFRPEKRRNLDSVELELIHLAASLGLPLTNKVSPSDIVGETDLDELLAPDEQELWRANPAKTSAQDVRLNLDADGSHRTRYKHEWSSFRDRDDLSQLLGLLRLYIHGCVPAYRRTEYSFWSVSCMPSTNAAYYPRLAAVNMNIMETFVVFHPKHEPDNVLSFVNLSKARLLEQYPSKQAFYRQYPGTEWWQSSYRAAGEDQMSVELGNLSSAIRVLADPAVQSAAGLLNLRLMRKGGNIYARFHCFELADQLIGEESGYASYSSQMPLFT
jgi:hypothetical protein